jgi:hypothetical protein
LANATPRRYRLDPLANAPSHPGCLAPSANAVAIPECLSPPRMGRLPTPTPTDRPPLANGSPNPKQSAAQIRWKVGVPSQNALGTQIPGKRAQVVQEAHRWLNVAKILGEGHHSSGKTRDFAKTGSSLLPRGSRPLAPASRSQALLAPHREERKRASRPDTLPSVGPLGSGVVTRRIHERRGSPQTRRWLRALEFCPFRHRPQRPTAGVKRRRGGSAGAAAVRRLRCIPSFLPIPIYLSTIPLLPRVRTSISLSPLSSHLPHAFLGHRPPTLTAYLARARSARLGLAPSPSAPVTVSHPLILAGSSRATRPLPGVPGSKSLIPSVPHSLIPLFPHSPNSLIPSSTHSPTRSVPQSPQSLIHALPHSHIHSFTHSLISLIPSFSHSTFTHSLVRSFSHPQSPALAHSYSTSPHPTPSI